MKKKSKHTIKKMPSDYEFDSRILAAASAAVQTLRYIACKQMAPRVFVSSVMENFNEFRKAAKRGIEGAGGEPVLIEGYPGLPISSRSACLDAVRSSDILLVVVGDRGGWKTPSGKLVVEEEYDEAKRLKKQALIFVQEAEHDEDAQHFIEKVSDYVHGEYRKTFKTATQLKTLVENSLKPLVEHNKKPNVKERIMDDILKEAHKIPSQTTLRFVLIPEREDQLIDPLDLESEDLEAQIIDIGTSSDVKLFSRRMAKDVEVGVDEIGILQTSKHGGTDSVDEVRLELTSLGRLIIDINVTGRAKGDFVAGAISMVILESEVVDALRKCFAFARDFFNTKDPYRRHDRMLYNAALSGIGYRQLVRAIPTGAVSMNMSGEDTVVAFDRPQIVVRKDLIDPTNEIDRTLAMLGRRMKAG